jgi:hypothetical protein
MTSNPIAVPEVPTPAPESVVTTPPETVLSVTTQEKAPETVLAAPPPTSEPTPLPAPEKTPATPAVPEIPSIEQVLATPAPEKGKETDKEAGLSGASTEKTQEALAAGSTPEDPLSGSGILATPAGPQNIEPHNEAAATEVPGAGSGLLAFAGLSSAEPPSAAGAGPVSVGGTPGTTAAREAGELTCELSALAGHVSGSCTADLLRTQAQGFVSEAPGGLAAAAASLAVAVGGTGGGGHGGGSAVENPPVSPGPGPAPSGASGAAAGGSGLALSGFLTLAGLLLLGAPRAMRRLRLSCEPWLTACFVLIPERPG